VNLEDVERNLRTKLDALGPRVRAELLNALMLPDYERAARIGDCWLDPRSRTFAELLIDAEESPATRGVLIGMLRDAPSRIALALTLQVSAHRGHDLLSM